MLRKGNWWMMLSNGDRWSQQPKPWNDAVEFARHYIKVAPDRMIWGSDWPHPLVPASDPPKDDGELLELVYRYAETDEVKRKILVDNPARLFGFKN
jgi:predicted TIM-barrel fold metal-dependent hydrolase